jgi:GGDEF domain-containing protein
MAASKLMASPSHTGGRVRGVGRVSLRPAVLERLKTLIEGVTCSPPAESSELSDIPSLLRRVAFDRDIDAMATAASEAGEPLTPVMSDVDHFKAVNGILSVMKFCGKPPASSGRALDRKVLPTGTGGEEFAVLLPNYFSAEAIALAERMRRSIERTQDEQTTGIFGAIDHGIDELLAGTSRAGRERLSVRLR